MQANAFLSRELANKKPQVRPLRQN